MAATVQIDEQLLQEAMEGNTNCSQNDVVADAMRQYIQMRAQERLRGLRGKIAWEGNLEESRQGRLTE